MFGNPRSLSRLRRIKELGAAGDETPCKCPLEKGGLDHAKIAKLLGASESRCMKCGGIIKAKE